MYVKTRWLLATLLVGLGAALLVLIASDALAQGDGWASPSNLSNTEGSSYAPRLAVDAQDTVHLVWQDWIDLDPHWPYILYANKPAGGAWTPYTYLPGYTQGGDPAMVIDANGTLHIVFGEPNSVSYIRRQANGTWSGIESVATNGEFYGPDVAVAPDGTVHAAWRERVQIDDGTTEVYFKIYHSARTPSGEWSPPVLLYEVDAFASSLSFPYIAADTDGTAHLLVEVDSQAMYRSKPRDGDWSASKALAFDPTMLSVEQFTSDSQGELHLAWVGDDWQSGQCNVLYASKPVDQTWSGPHTVFSGPCVYFDIHSVAVAADGQGLAHVAWTVGSGDKSVWYAFERAGGAWAAPSLASAGLVGYDHTPSVAVDGGGGRHIAWDSGPVEIPPTEDMGGEIWYTGLTGWPPVSGVITPTGGTLTSASGNTSLVFPPGAVTTDAQVTHSPAAASPSGDLFGVRFFDLSAERVSDGTPVTSFNKSYTLTA